MEGLLTSKSVRKNNSWYHIHDTEWFLYKFITNSYEELGALE